jgi:ribosomal protein L12E/L44/L45/RPP1/RPP2
MNIMPWNAAISVQGAERDGYIPMNMDTAKLIYDYFYHKELWFDIAKTIVFALTFKGGVSESWGGGLFQKSGAENGAEDEGDEGFEGAGSDDGRSTSLEALLTAALEYRLMFGMCPLHVIRGSEGTEDQKTIVIPEFGTGKFMMKINGVTKTNQIIFVPDNATNSTSSGREIEERSADYYVYVWPGCSPSYGLNKFRSTMSKLLERWTELKEATENAGDADYNSSHPTLFTQMRKDQRTLSEFTEEEIFADADEDVDTPGTKNTYRRFVAAARMMEDRQRMARERGMSGEMTQRVDPRTNKLVMHKRKRQWEGNEYTLDEGVEMVHQVVPKSRADYQEMKMNYELEACLAMGVPKAFIDRQGTSTKLKGDVENENMVVKNMVEKNRKACMQFYEYVYNLLHKDEDDAYLVNVLSVLSDAETRARERETDGMEGKTLDEVLQNIGHIKTNVLSVAKMQSRSSLKFRGDPFQNDRSTEEVMSIASAGAMSELEEINMYRKRLRLPPIKESDPLVSQKRQLKEILKKQEEVKAIPKPTPQGKTQGGAAAKKPKKKKDKPEKKKE